MVSITQTLSQIKSQEFIGHIQKHFITSPLTCHQWHSRFSKMVYQKLGAPRPLTRHALRYSDLFLCTSIKTVYCDGRSPSRCITDVGTYCKSKHFMQTESYNQIFWFCNLPNYTNMAIIIMVTLKSWHYYNWLKKCFISTCKIFQLWPQLYTSFFSFFKNYYYLFWFKLSLSLSLFLLFIIFFFFFLLFWELIVCVFFACCLFSLFVWGGGRNYW